MRVVDVPLPVGIGIPELIVGTTRKVVRGKSHG
jgi:hypothetical protein